MKKLLSLFVAVGILATAFGQNDKITLTIGDKAPSFRYSKWLKGTPISDFSKDGLYVLEFWATWCGPCIAAMPHLSDLADKYKDRATVIGVNVWERTSDKPYESSLPDVERFVESNAERMRYHVAADNNDQYIANNWLKPAGILGIPATIVVKDGKIVWIGHPMKLDEVMDPIIDGTFDVSAFKTKYEGEAKATLDSGNAMKAAYTAVQDAVSEKDFDKAFRLIDEGIEKLPILTMTLKAERFNILLNHFEEEKALAYGKELIAENPSYETTIAVAICDKDGLDKSTYLFAASLLKKATDAGSFSALYDKLALAYSKADDIDAAIAAQTQSVKAAQAEVDDPKYQGRVFDHTITGYEEKLRVFQQEKSKREGGSRLTIGDPAPKMEARWIKGEKIESFEKGTVYVLEFWATWCGPCIKAMPHVSELARKHAGKAKVIGISVWERGKPGQDLHQMIEDFVKNMGNKMDYSVYMDDTDSFVAKNWLDPLGQSSIPVTVIVDQEGKIAWVGQPMEMDEPLTKIIDDTFDKEAFAREFSALQAHVFQRQQQQQDVMTLLKPLLEAAEAKDYTTVLSVYEGLVKKQPELKKILAPYYYPALAKTNSDKARSEIADLEASGEEVGVVARAIAPVEGLDKSFYEYAIAYFATHHDNPLDIQAASYAYYHVGNFEKAVESLQKFIDWGTNAKAPMPTEYLEKELSRLEQYKTELQK